MLKNHFGNLSNKAEETKKEERKQKKIILNEIYLYNLGKGYNNVDNRCLTRFNPFISSIILKVSFLYLKTYSSNNIFI